MLEPMVYVSGPVRIEVPRGFITDYASVPRILWPLFPPRGRYSRAAVLHDYLYRSLSVSRVVADALFLESMRTLGVTWRCWPMYLGVRLGGWVPYRTYRKTQK